MSDSNSRNNATWTPMLGEMKHGHAEAWEQFTDRYLATIHRWLSQLGASQHDVDDLSQEVLAFVFQRLPSFEHNGRTGAFRRWLRLIVRNRFREHLRKSQQQRAHQSDQSASQVIDPRGGQTARIRRDHAVQRTEAALQRIAADFTPQSLQIFRETALGGRSSKAVAQDLGISEGAVRVAKSRVGKALAEASRQLAEDDSSWA